MKLYVLWCCLVEREAACLIYITFQRAPLVRNVFVLRNLPKILQLGLLLKKNCYQAGTVATFGICETVIHIVCSFST